MFTNTVKLYSTPVNNHGCRGFEVEVLPLTDDIGVVVGGEACSSCWQVGHDDGGSPIPVGTLVQLPDWSDIANLGILEDWRVWLLDAPVYVPGEYEPVKVKDVVNTGAPYETVCGGYAPYTEGLTGWEVASLGTGYSHNELVNDLDSPESDCTLVQPEDLVKIRNEEFAKIFAAGIAATRQ